MFNTFSRSWDATKASLRILNSDKALASLPLISFIIMLIVTVSFAIPIGLVFEGSSSTDEMPLLGYVITFLFYVVSYTVAFYFNSVLTYLVYKKLEGTPVTKGEAFSMASSKLGTIISYSVIASTVGILLNILSQKGGLIGKIVSGIGGMAWNLATFFVVPVMVIENVGPTASIKKSTALLKKTWGEQLVGGLAVGGAVFLFAIPFIILSIILLIAAISSESVGLIIMAALIFVLTIIVFSLIGATLSNIFRVVLYRYTVTGKIPEGINEDLVKNAFHHKAQKNVANMGI